MGGMLLAISVCMLIQPTGEEPVAEEPQTAVARLLVAEAPGDSVKVYAQPALENRASGEQSEVPLSPMMYLLAGDELEISAGASVVLLCYVDGTCQRHYGPARVRAEAKGIAILTGETQPEVEQAHVLVGPLEVSDRTSQHGAVSVLRYVSDDVPVPEYPDYVTVVPGRTTLRWTYEGEDEHGRLILLDSESGVTDAVEVALAAGCQDVDVSAGGTYYWWIELPGNEVVPAMFNVLDQVEWRLVQGAMAACNATAEDLAEALDAIESAEDAAYITAILQYYELRQEAAIALARLQELCEPER